MIKRYGFVGWEAFDEKDNGLYVLYTDHLAVVAEKDAEIERLKETTIDVWIKVPKEDSDDSAMEDVT